MSGNGKSEVDPVEFLTEHLAGQNPVEEYVDALLKDFSGFAAFVAMKMAFVFLSTVVDKAYDPKEGMQFIIDTWKKAKDKELENKIREVQEMSDSVMGQVFGSMIATPEEIREKHEQAFAVVMPKIEAGLFSGIDQMAESIKEKMKEQTPHEYVPED